MCLSKISLAACKLGVEAIGVGHSGLHMLLCGCMDQDQTFLTLAFGLGSHHVGGDGCLARLSRGNLRLRLFNAGQRRCMRESCNSR